jgi:hypothetical protein
LQYNESAATFATRCCKSLAADCNILNSMAQARIAARIADATRTPGFMRAVAELGSAVRHLLAMAQCR